MSPKPKKVYRHGHGQECWICEQQSRSIHEHHVIMRSKTGELGPKIWLCGTCHTEIHAVATARAAKLRGGKPNELNLVWAHSRHSQEQHRAEMVITPLVKILLMSDKADLPVLTSLQLDPEINAGLNQLKQELGLQNKPQTILWCVALVLHSKGLISGSIKPKIKRIERK